jgi:hypothetical protein
MARGEHSAGPARTDGSLPTPCYILPVCAGATYKLTWGKKSSRFRAFGDEAYQLGAMVECLQMRSYACFRARHIRTINISLKIVCMTATCHVISPLQLLTRSELQSSLLS